MSGSVTAYLAECLGTALLMFTIIFTGNFVAIGAALAVAIYAATRMSMQCFNPAVAIAFMWDGRLSKSQTVMYILAEVVGALLAVEIYRRVR